MADQKADKAEQEKDAAKAVAEAVKPSDELVSGSDDGATVSTATKMVAEPGHRRAEAAVAAGAWDPNVARRLEEGRGPGMQDSEAMQPATWIQPSDNAAADLARANRQGNAPEGAPDNRPEKA